MSQCPNHEELERFRGGELDDAREWQIRDHIETCPRCARHDSAVVDRFDDLIEHIRGMGLSAGDIDAMRASEPPRRPAGAPNVDIRQFGSVEQSMSSPDGVPGFAILKEVHRGGQGVVYQALQKSTKRKVAIKILLEGPYASKAAKRRFEREIELVASLRHPNIVPVYDSGVTPDGRSYCVMDYVSGKRLDHYLRDNKPAMPQALSLFATICETVNYAHQKGVIHRDLKPSNILVESDGTPKVLDFGLAKQMAGATDPILSMTGQIIGTLPYLSPEQARGSQEGVDIRTDVYSLGVILYEMITGRYPYPVTGELPDIVRHITETDPSPPSKVWQAESGIQAAAGGPRATLKGCPVGGDVETIVLKTLSKQPERRYQSALELARDVRHYLAGEPITARRDSSWYVLRRTMRKHRGPVTVGVAFLILLIAWSITLWFMYSEQKLTSEYMNVQAQEARASRDRALDAEAEAKRRYGQLVDLSTTLIFDFHDELERLPGSTHVRKVVVGRGLSMLDRLASEATEDVKLQRNLAEAYKRISDIQGGVGRANLGDLAGAQESCRKAYDILTKTYEANPDDWGMRRSLAGALSRLGILASNAGRPEEASELMHKGHALFESSHEQEPDNAVARRDLAVSHSYLARLLARQGKTAEAMEHWRTCLAHDEVLAKQEPDSIDAQSDLLICCNEIGHLLTQAGRPDDALEMHRKALDISKMLAEQHPENPLIRRDYSIALERIGSLLIDRNEVDEGAECYREMLQIDAEQAAADPDNMEAQRDLAISRQRMGDLYARLSQFDKSLISYRASLAICERLSAASPESVAARSDLGLAHGKLCDFYFFQGANAEAAAPCETALEIRREVFQRDPSDMNNRVGLSAIMDRAGAIRTSRGDVDGALAIFAEALALAAATAESDPTNVQAQRNRGAALFKMGQTHATCGDRTDLPKAVRIKHWQDAAVFYRKCHEAWLAVGKRSDLQPAEMKEIAGLLDSIDLCADEIEALQAESDAASRPDASQQ